MVQHSGEFSEQGTDVLGALGNFNVEELLNSKGKALLVGHHGNVVQPVEVGKSLEVRLVLDQLLGTSVEEADVRVGADDFLAIQLENKPKHTVGSGMLGTKVDGVVPDLAVLDRVLARLLNGAGNVLGGAVGVAGVGKVFVDGDQPGAHGLRSSVSSKTCRREGSGCGMCRCRSQAEALGALASEPPERRSHWDGAERVPEARGYAGDPPGEPLAQGQWLVG